MADEWANMMSVVSKTGSWKFQEVNKIPIGRAHDNCSFLNKLP